MSFARLNAKEQRAYDTALRRIETCRQEGLGGTVLNLNGLDLTMLPQAIGQLTALKRLEIRHNQLITLPPQFGRLTALNMLDLSHNHLATLPPEIGRLKMLTELRLHNNQLSVLPPEIGHLTGLTMLDLSGNRLTKLPPEIGQLVALTDLRLTNNQLMELPSEFGSLIALTELFLWRNELSEMPREIGQLSALKVLHIDENKLRMVPPEIGQLTGLARFHLDGNQITTLPPEIGLLTTLTELKLDNNRITALPPELGQLDSLTKLQLSGNRLTRLPSEIGKLITLRELHLPDNQITSLPKEIGRLTGLILLDLGGNRLTTLPPQIGDLKMLIEVDLSNNHLTTLPPEIGQLALLTGLELSCNRLSTVPSEIGHLTALKELYLHNNRLVTLPEGLRELPRLERLTLHDNPGLKLSPSILGGDPRKTDMGLTSAKSILDFYFDREQGNTRPLNEVKVILVGRGSAGKTCTGRALRGLPFRSEEDPTPGIALFDCQIAGGKCGPVTAHLWDFAGQVITHALHQFFFSVRTVYLVVLTGRENNEREDAEYWLRLIKAFGTDADGCGPPVLIALNKWDVAGCRPRVDRGALRERYPFIRGFVETDCKTERGISELKAMLASEVSRLKWVREAFPRKWDAIRRALSMGKGKRAHLTYSEYRALCNEHGVTDAGQQDSLAEILHNLGAALNYRNDPRLREATVLQPEWLTENVYALMRHAEKHEGVLMQAEVDGVLRGEKDKKMREYLVQLMERFEIAYPARTAAGGRWLVPQALPDTQPEGVEQFAAAAATRLRYSYQALPEGLVARAIVRLHEFIEEVKGKKQQWASGAILTREGARALIRTEPQDRQVMITVTGPTKVRQRLAGLCQAEMRDIHGEIRGLDPLEETQVNGAWVLTETLAEDERQRRNTGVPTRDRGTMEVSPEELNNEYSERASRMEEVWKPTVFISYSKSNVNQRKRLESELKILKLRGLLANAWHDRMIDPGSEWDAKIQRELGEADVVVILVSSAALATNYIAEHEIPMALELHNEKQTVVVPVILEASQWEETALGPLNALPEKGKPLNKWKPPSDGWFSVASGLEKVFRKLIDKRGRKKQQLPKLDLKRAGWQRPDYSY